MLEPKMSQGSQSIAQFYDVLPHIQKETADGGFLTFAPFTQKHEGFSWLNTFLKPHTCPEFAQLTQKTLKRFREVLFEGIAFDAINTVQDIGCGYGTDLIALANHYPHITCYGHTLSAEQREFGSTRAAQKGVSDRVTIFQRNSATEAFEAQADLCFGFEVAVYVKDKTQLFRNITDHLKPGSVVVLADVMTTTRFQMNSDLISSYIATQPEWETVLSQHQLYPLSIIDVTQEIGHFLDDPHFDQHLDSCAKEFGLSQNDSDHLKGMHQLGKGLRAGLVRYLLFKLTYLPTIEPKTIADRLHGCFESPEQWIA